MRARTLVLGAAVLVGLGFLVFNLPTVLRLAGERPAVAETLRSTPLGAVLPMVPVPGAQDSRIPRCDPLKPSFLYGFAALNLQLGPAMGEPLECERAIHVNGDTQQRTSVGYAYYRKVANIPTFTNGWDHWALTDRGLVHWEGDVVDPPGVAKATEATR